MQCHCKRRFRNLLRNHCSCIWIITETPASPTSYYCKHSNSCHASKKFATQTLESGGSRAEPELESGLLQRAIATCMDLMRPLALFGPCAVSSQTWQYSRNSVKAAWRTKAYFQQSYTNTTAKGRFQQLWCARKRGWALLLYLDGDFLFIARHETLMKPLSLGSQAFRWPNMSFHLIENQEICHHLFSSLLQANLCRFLSCGWELVN